MPGFVLRRSVEHEIASGSAAAYTCADGATDFLASPDVSRFALLLVIGGLVLQCGAGPCGCLEHGVWSHPEVFFLTEDEDHDHAADMTAAHAEPLHLCDDQRTDLTRPAAKKPHDGATWAAHDTIGLWSSPRIPVGQPDTATLCRATARAASPAPPVRAALQVYLS
jgi:hypothetical protein